MNKVILIGRTVRDAEVRYSGNDNSNCVAKFTIAVVRKIKRENEVSADFISCVAFGKIAQFLEKYGTKGTKFAIEGRIQTGSYTNKDGQKVYTTDVVVEQIEFAESKNFQEQPKQQPAVDSNGFMNIPEGIEDDELPFN